MSFAQKFNWNMHLKIGLKIRKKIMFPSFSAYWPSPPRASSFFSLGPWPIRLSPPFLPSPSNAWGLRVSFIPHLSNRFPRQQPAEPPRSHFPHDPLPPPRLAPCSFERARARASSLPPFRSLSLPCLTVSAQ